MPRLTASVLLLAALAMLREAPSVQAQDAATPADTTTPRHTLRFYGSIRVRSLVSAPGEFEIVDRFSRLGLSGDARIVKGLHATAQLELGVNVVNQNPVLVAGDPGFAVGEGNQAVTSRLGTVGLAWPGGSARWGKQWAVWYDLAGWTDMAHTFGGEAAGAYAAGTDGGISGTGRAEKAMQVGQRVGPVSAAFQMQNRRRADPNPKLGDTWTAGGTVYALHDALAFAGAYHEVRDGVSDPAPNQAKAGDRGWIFGARLVRPRFTLAASVNRTWQHEVDDEETFFDARGIEAYAELVPHPSVTAFVLVNSLEPLGDYGGEYRVLYEVVGGSWTVTPYLQLMAEVRVTQSHNAGGGERLPDAIAFGMNWNFSLSPRLPS